MRRDDPRVLSVAALLAVAAIYVALAAPLVHTPLRGDEQLWPRQAHAIDLRGIPKVPFGADAYVWTKDSFAGRYGADYGLWHPPGYLYLLATAEEATANWRVAGRGLALLLGLATIALQFCITRRLALRGGWNPRRAVVTATIGGLALGTAPYWVFESMLVDIDPGALSLATLGAAAGVIAVTARPNPRSSLVLTALLVTLMWIKPAAYPFLAAGAVGFALLRRDRRLTMRFVLLFGLGLVTFAGTWALYVAWSGVPWDYPWRFSYFGSSASGRGSGALRPGTPFTIANTARIVISQLGWPSTLIGVAAVAGLVARAVRKRAPHEWDVLTLVGLLTVAFYVIIFPFPGKYVLPGFAPLLCAGALELVAALHGIRIPRCAGIVAALSMPVVFVFQLLVVGDMISGPKVRLLTQKSFGNAAHDPRITKYALALLPLILVAVAFRFGRVPRRTAVIIAVVTVLLPWNAAESIAIRPQQHEWILPTRERGFRQALRWIDANVRKGDLIESYWDVGSNMQKGRIIPIDEFGMSWSVPQAGAALETRPVTYVLLSRARFPGDPAYVQPLERYFRPIRSLGDWVIYARTS